MTRKTPASDQNRRALDDLQEAVNDTANPGDARAKRRRLRCTAKEERDTR